MKWIMGVLVLRHFIPLWCMDGTIIITQTRYCTNMICSIDTNMAVYLIAAVARLRTIVVAKASDEPNSNREWGANIEQPFY